MTGGGKNEIRRSRTTGRQKMEQEKENDGLRKSATVKQPADFPVAPAGMPEEVTRAEKNKDPELLNRLKEKTEAVPVLIPAVKQEEKTGQKLRQRIPVRRNAVEDAKEALRELHENLTAEENSVFSENIRGEIRRTRYDDLSASDIRKRAKEAVKRRANAQKIMEFDAEKAGRELKITHIDQATLKKNIAAFKKLPSHPYDLDTDEKFLANLEKNYQLCEVAEKMKHWLKEASDQDFMPKGEDMAALQEKIEIFSEVKRYMDLQKDLMKNPYYQYFARKDISYTDKQLEHFSGKTKDPILRNYLTDVRALRSLKFVRSRGMKSVEKHAREEGKRQAELLATRQEKRLLMDTLADKAMQISEEQRFQDKDHDATFNAERFQQALKRFQKLDPGKLHFAGIRDMTEHFAENQRIFDQVHDMEHLMMVALNRDLAIADQEMIRIRAKMETFILAEQMVASVQKTILSDPEAFLNEKTFRELEENCHRSIRSITDGQERHEPPKFGQDMSRYFRSLLKTYQQEHKDREKNIKLIYGMTHPEQGEETVPGRIPEKELRRRSADYQRNAYRADYMRNLETYMQDIYGSKIHSVAAVHAKRTGRPRFADFGRTLTPFLAGKNAEEITRVIDIMQVGTAEAKEKLFREVAEEAFRTNLSDYDTHDPAAFYRNAAARARKAKIINNLGGSTGEAKHYIREPEFMARIEGYYNASCGQDYSSSMSQAVRWNGGKGFWYEDFFSQDPDMITILLRTVGDRIDEQEEAQKEEHGEGEYKGSFRVGDETYHMSVKEFVRLEKSVDRVPFMKSAGLSGRHADRAAKGIRDRANIMLYDELKAAGYHKTVTGEELKQLREYYQEYDKEYTEADKTLVEGVKKKLKNKVPGIEKHNSKRTWMISNLKLLSESKEEKRSEDESLEKSASLYKGLLVNTNKMGAPERQERARAMEEMFRVIMDFDLARLSFRSYPDLIRESAEDPNRFKECHAVTRLAMEAVNFLSDYRQLRNDEEVSCLLNAVNVDEIEARCDLLMSAEALFDGNFLKIMESPALQASGYSLDDVLHLAPEEIERKLQEATADRDTEKISFWTNVMATTTCLEGFDIGIPASAVEEHFRKKKGLLEQSRVTETRNILNRRERVIDEKKTGRIGLSIATDRSYSERFGEVFREKLYTVSEREEKIFNKRSRLYVKRINSEKLMKNSDDTLNALSRAKAGISLANRMAVGEERLADLSAFMKGENVSDNKMAERYADQKQRFGLMDELTREIMEMNLSLRAVTDEEFAASAGELEKISQKVMAYDRMLKANPEYLDRLRNRRIGSSRTDLEAVEGRLEHMQAISDYYRARKLLLSDNHFILHYDDELSAEQGRNLNEDQRRISELLRLVSTCGKRLEAGDFSFRDKLGLDTVLQMAEQRSRQQAYLIGRPDLAKADPAKVHKANKEIEKYMKAAGLDEMSAREARELIAQTEDKKPFPQAEKYRTEAVKNYMDTLKTFAKSFDPNLREQVMSPQERDLYRKLQEMLKTAKGASITTAELRDPVTGEVWKLSTNLQRFITPMVMDYGQGVPTEEILDIFDGLTLTQREKIDMTDEKQRLYVRERWLNSMQKLFFMEYNSVKRYENTYGTLVDEMPPGCFFASLGSGLKNFVTRNMFGQDVANMSDKNSHSDTECVVNGENMTTAQLLVKYGKVSPEAAEDCYMKNSQYYQAHLSNLNIYLQSPVTFGQKEDGDPVHYVTGDLHMQQYTKDHIHVGGPKLSAAESRKLWKGARQYEGDINLTGGENYLNFQKNKLDLYTADEKKEIKKERAKDQNLLHFYQFDLDERREKLLSEARTKLGSGISDELLQKLIEFHPRMLAEKEGDAKVEDFYTTVKQFVGIGIPAEQQETARKEAAGKLYRHWSENFRFGKCAGSIPELMGYKNLSKKERKGQARENENSILEGSKLFIGEARHRMYESVLQLFAADEEAEGLLSANDRKELQERLKKQLDQEILRTLITNKDYLALKDIGSQRKTYGEKMFQELIRLRGVIGAERSDLYRDILDRDGRAVLDYFGIPYPVKAEKKAEPEVKAEEKKAEPEVKAEEKKDEQAVLQGLVGDALQSALQELEQEEAQEELKAGQKAEENKEESAVLQELVGDALKNAMQELEQEEAQEELKAEQKEEQKEEKKLREQPALPYQKTVYIPERSKGIGYENQGKGTNYCWACAMNGLLNHRAGKKISTLQDVKNRPLAVPAFEESGIDKRDEYDKGVRLVNEMYQGTEAGSPVMFGDYIFEKSPNTAVVSASVGRIGERIDYCKRRFLETLARQLEKGPVGLRKGDHFILVKGLVNDDQLIVNDSLKSKPEMDRPYEMTVSELFSEKEAKSALELVWLEDIRGHEQEIAGEYDLNFDEQKQEFSVAPAVMEVPGKAKVEQPRNAETILHRNGVEGSAMLEDDVVIKSIYVPKKLKRDDGPGGQQEPHQEEQQKVNQENQENQEQKQREQQEVKQEQQKEEQKEMQEVKQQEKKPLSPEKYAKELEETAGAYNKVLDQTFRFVYASDPKAFFGEGTQEHRHMRRQINMLHYFGKLDSATMDDAYHALMVDTRKASVKQKNLKAREYERIFEHILDIDLQKFNIQSMEDAFSSKHMDAAVTAGAIFDFQPSLMRDYEKLLKDPEVRCSLDENQFKEVKAKWDLIHSNFSWISIAPKYAEVIRKRKIDISELLKLNSAELAELSMNCADQKNKGLELYELYSWLMVTKASWETSGYRGPGDDVERVLQEKRKSDEYKLPENKSYKEEALKAIRVRLAEDEGRIFDRVVDTTLEPTLKQQMEKVEEQFRGTSVSKAALTDMKKTSTMAYRITEEQNNAITKSTTQLLKKRTHNGSTFDLRGLTTMLRPVKLDKDGNPLTEQDQQNRKLNEKDAEDIGTNRLSDRAGFLERVVKEARELMFTTAELKDHKFLLKNRERAIRHLRLMHNLLNLYTKHEDYFLNKASAEAREFLFMLTAGSDYVNYQAYHIQNALQAQGLGAVGVGGSSGVVLALSYDGTIPYKDVVAENKKIAQMGPGAAMNYVAQMKAMQALDTDVLHDPEAKKSLKQAIKEGKEKRLDDYTLTEGERILLTGELPKGTKTFGDAQREAVMMKYLDCFAAKNKADLAKTASDRKKLNAYIEEYKKANQRKIENAVGIIDDLP